jgi:two-component system, NarL family, response regulator LiaR
MTELIPIRVMLVDDHIIVRRGLGTVLSISDDMCLVGEAGNGEEAIQLCERLQPDVILMDVLMPKMDGIAATKAIHERWPKVRIIALTSFKEREYVEGVLKAGATSYLLKNVSADELVSAIRRAVAGLPSLSPEAAQILIQEVNEPAQPGSDLSDRERDILALMAKGESNGEIAEHIFLSKSTVKFHVSSILSKLGVSSRTEAVFIAMKHHMVK